MHAKKTKFFGNERKIFDDYQEKQIYTSIALQQAIERNSIIREIGREFLDIYDEIATDKSEIFARVLSDPTAYHWCLLTYELVKASLTGKALPVVTQHYCQAIGQTTPANALREHLSQFKLFAIASYFLSQESYRFKTPFIPRLPLAIPFTEFYIEGTGSVEIYAIDGGKLEIGVDGSKTYLELAEGATLGDGHLLVGRCPVIQYKGCKLRLQPYSFNSPAFPDGRTVVEVGMAYQAEYAAVVRDGLELVERHQPQTFKQFRDFMQVIALKPGKLGSFQSFSSSDFPGTLICNGINNPYLLADIFIHEFHHNRLFAIEDNTPLLLDSVEDSEVNKKYYSPWRQDLRPLRGIIHGLYVFTPVSHFWLDVYRSGTVSGELLDFTRSQIILRVLQLQIALEQLRKYSQFTAMGRELFEELEERVARLTQVISQTDFTLDMPALEFQENGSFIHTRRKRDAQSLSVKEAIMEHIHRFDRFNQVDVELQERLGLKT